MPLPVPGLHGAHLRSELIRLFGRRWLSNALANNELRPLWRGVVVESRRELDPWTRAAAAQLTTGPASVITGVTAARLLGCKSVDAPKTHVLVRYGCGTRSRSGLMVHRGGFFTEDVMDLDGIRVLPLDRVIGDLLCKLSPQDALAVADEALRLAGAEQELVRKQIGERLRRRQDRRGTVRGAAILDLASSRAESPPESWLRMMLVEREFPIPEVNWPILAPDGHEIYRLDLAWPGLRIALEYDGYEAHAGREAQDGTRDEDLRRRGWIVIRVRADDLRDPARVLGLLRAAFARRGYTW